MKSSISGHVFFQRLGLRRLAPSPRVIAVHVLAMIVGTAVAQEFMCFDRETDRPQLQYVGATDSYTRDEAPWMVNLSFGEGPFCGGALVNESTVLTAAHCVRPNTTARRADVDGSPYGEALRVVRYTVHPDYDPTANISGSDLALLRLEGQFNVSLSQLPYLLDPARAASWGLAGDCAWAMGWGVTREAGRVTSPVLAGGHIPIWPDGACHESYGDAFFDGDVCAGYEEGKTGTCQGDSGGPLLVRGGPTGVIQVGVVSYGLGCARENYPTVYVRVSAFYDWIFSAAETLSRP